MDEKATASFSPPTSVCKADQSQNPLRVPFRKEKELARVDEIIYPVAIRRRGDIIFPERDTEQFLRAELKTPKLNKLHSRLWLAGLPIAARSLQRQRMMNRSIVLTERPDEHLVWFQDRLFVKPVPSFLFSFEFWERNLCRDIDLHRSARGMLLSYSWLVEYRSDFEVAKTLYLIPGDLEWTAWVGFFKHFTSRTNLETLEQVNPRYQYGELRLSRLNLIIRFLSPGTWSVRNLVFGFTSTPTWYGALFARRFGWLVAILLYISVILAALQVGLATPMLGDNIPFVNLSYWCTLASIAGVVLAAATILVFWATLFWYHLLSTMVFRRKIQKGRVFGYYKMSEGE